MTNNPEGEPDKVASLMSSLGMEDMNIPELKLVQGVGGDYAKASGAKLGQFFVSTTNDIYDKLDVQVLHVAKQRTFWGRTDITDDPPICSSTDGITSLEGQPCKQCQHYRERASMDKDERRKECQLSYMVLALDINQMPLIIRLSGISADAGRDLNAMLYFNKGLRSDRGGYFFRISSFEKKSAAGTAYAFKFTLQKEEFPDETMKLEYKRVAQDMRLLAVPTPDQRIAPAPMGVQITPVTDAVNDLDIPDIRF